MNRRKFLMNTMGAAILASPQGQGKISGRQPGRLVVGDSQLQIDLSYGPQGLEEKLFRVDGGEMPSLAGVPWSANLDGEDITPESQAAGLYMTPQINADECR